MELNFRVLQVEDLPVLQSFEKDLLSPDLNSMEGELLSWSARWRTESLEHYLPLGWSFGAWENPSMAGASGFSGYFLAQPLVFFRGLTQTLWLEHLGYNTLNVAEALVDVAYRLSREKHFQTLILENDPRLSENLSRWKVEPLANTWLQIKTSRFKD